MNIALRRAMTVDEYLAWNDSQSERQRTELINGQIVTMPGGPLRLDPPGLSLTVEDLLGTA